mmetsp:Transcript_66029/g.157884  ORF Transcript_66029/g.157884 Transcript_66029/m.157884 type:complete len:293 (+) Transcript_66029:132-1010(+)
MADSEVVEPASKKRKAAESAEHHDASRSAVPVTSVLVGHFRALESKKPPAERLFHDPVAEEHCLDFDWNTTWVPAAGYSKEAWTNFMALRTRWIDDKISELLPKQLVLLGAGLDARAFRMECLKQSSVFEVDFPEVLTAKNEMLHGTPSIAKRVCAPANLSLHNWPEQVAAAGFDRAESSTVWLLEGLTGYLTGEELDALFATLGEAMSTTSLMLVSFVSTKMRDNKNGIGQLHRRSFEDVDEVQTYLKGHGWSAQVSEVQDIAKFYKREEPLPDFPYFVAVATKCSVPASK